MYNVLSINQTCAKFVDEVLQSNSIITLVACSIACTIWYVYRIIKCLFCNNNEIYKVMTKLVCTYDIRKEHYKIYLNHAWRRPWLELLSSINYKQAIFKLYPTSYKLFYCFTIIWFLFYVTRKCLQIMYIVIWRKNQSRRKNYQKFKEGTNYEITHLLEYLKINLIFLHLFS